MGFSLNTHNTSEFIEMCENMVPKSLNIKFNNMIYHMKKFKSSSSKSVLGLMDS